jgi:tetratricopeptide (TPR) repeat protein
MASISNSTKEQFEQQAANDWDLESLYKELASAKQKVAPHKRKGLTVDEKPRLCGLLCGYSPAEIAQKLVISSRGVEVYLCDTVYRYVEQLTKRPRNTVKNWRDIPEWLEEAGYKTQLSESVKGEGAIANPNAAVSQADESDLDALVEKVRSQTDPSIAEILRILQGIKQNEQLSISSANLISIPPTLENWQGRSEEIQQLQAGLADTKVKIIGIQGLSGVGKSWLAAYLYKEAIEFESKFWADVRQGTDFTVFAQNALMKLAGKSPEELAALREPEQFKNELLDSLRQRPCLLVVDNLETLLDQKRHFIGIYKDFFNRWIEHGAVSTLLLTTQTQPEVMEGHRCWLPLQGLEANEGARLLQELGIVGSDEELQDFSRYLNGHPKMLRLVASKLKPGSHVREAEKLNFRQLDLLLNKVPMPYRDRERVLFVSILEQHFQDLTPTLQSFFLNLSLYRRSFERDAAAVLIEGEEPASAWETQQALDELVSRSLLDEIREKQGKYEFHPFVLQYAKQKAGNQPESLRQKTIAYYQSIAPDSSNWEISDDVTPYLEIFYHYCELKEYAQAFYTIFNGNDYENCIDNFLNLRGYNAIRANLYTQLLKIWQSNEPRTWELETAHTCLGDALNFLGQYHRAIDCFQQSLEIAQEIGDLEGKAGSLINIGLAYYDLEDFQQAFNYTRDGLNLAAENGYHKFEANAFNNMGLIYYANEEYHLAIDCYERSLAIKQDFGYYQSDASSLINLGDAYRCLGQHDKAIKFLKQGIDIAKQAGDRRFEAKGWFNLALALEALEDLELQSEAIAAYKNAREQYQVMGLDERVWEANDAIRCLSEALDGSED